MTLNATFKLLHLADVHLDRPFVGLAARDARARRRELREAFERCLSLAAEHRVDAVTIGGDLWEDEHVTPDTCRWVADRLESVGAPVVLIAGNHDPLRPGGPYRRVRWPANVRILPAQEGLQREHLGPLTVWGMSWGAAPLTAGALDAFAVPEDAGRHVLLLHGTAGGAAFERDAHCPFTAAAVRAAGFELCLAGHLHGGGVREGIVVYPGSPEPLAWDETGRHTVALVELPYGAPPRVELLDVNRRYCAEAVVDCEGAHSSAEIERALREAIAHAAERAKPPGFADGPKLDGLCLRAVLRGRIAPDCRVDLEDLAAAVRRPAPTTAKPAAAAENEISPSASAATSSPGLALLDLRDETQPAFDLDALASQPTALGAFVCALRERIAACSAEHDDPQQRTRLELALDLGLRAMHGDDLAHAT